ncbi:hypothetical protein [Saccharopolyspora phatthalungensis]|uniref:Uncharacterized protein n=1 Tax=Saccharopolyspora phatthalungensis TaxID=664693 RepID=A0A840QIU2_9PSEU|nr:hypothetical protein [Saccharopolyspora phatthalungensis]MBB5158575.1 hypothetical protein [Saccharopolyspora phatthalungensis]
MVTVFALTFVAAISTLVVVHRATTGIAEIPSAVRITEGVRRS